MIALLKDLVLVFAIISIRVIIIVVIKLQR